MSEYKNGLNSMGNMSVGKDDISHDPVTGRAVFIDDDRYDADSAYKAKVDGLIKQGFHKVSEGSGGGSSDFSTATVTVVNNSGMPVAFVSPLIKEDEGEEIFDTSAPIFNGELTLGIVLYKGTSAEDIYIDSQSDNITVTGNATYEDQSLVITGDCTITIGSSGGVNA